MKLIFLLLFIMVANEELMAQPSNTTIEIAGKIAQKMKSTLDLSVQQKDSIYAINVGLHKKKMEVRRLYNSTDSLTGNIQRIENQRDSLYKTVLTEPQYNLYREKKVNLISNN